jgi:SHS2 domain-containing protein
MVIYHPGKVIEVLSNSKEVISTEKKVQILLEMWDDNIITCDIESKLASKVKEDDVVLVDYGPISEKLTMPKHEVVKVIKGKTAEKIWQKYREHYRKKVEQPKIQPKPPVQIYG